MAFEAVLAVERPGSKRWKRLMVGVSLAIHAAALAVGVAYSFWTIDDLPLPAVAVTLVGGAPPPPPPPPPKKHSTGKTKPHVEKPKTLVQPKEHPEEKPKKEEAPDKDEEGAKDDGQEGGVKGGVAGGVVGGVVGAPVKESPKMLNAQTGRALLAINPNVDPYIVHLPPPLQRANVNFSADVYICVSAEGKVSSVKLVRGADPAIDSQIPTVLGRWRYRPYTIDGKPAPFCWPLRYQVSAK